LLHSLFDDVIARLPPETRRDFDRVRFALGLQGATNGEVAAALIALGYLTEILTGKRPFDRAEFRRYVRMDDKKWQPMA